MVSLSTNTKPEDAFKLQSFFKGDLDSPTPFSLHRHEEIWQAATMDRREIRGKSENNRNRGVQRYGSRDADTTARSRERAWSRGDMDESSGKEKGEPRQGERDPVRITWDCACETHLWFSHPQSLTLDSVSMERTSPRILLMVRLSPTLALHSRKLLVHRRLFSIK